MSTSQVDFAGAPLNWLVSLCTTDMYACPPLVTSPCACTIGSARVWDPVRLAGDEIYASERQCNNTPWAKCKPVNHLGPMQRNSFHTPSKQIFPALAGSDPTPDRVIKSGEMALQEE